MDRLQSEKSCSFEEFTDLIHSLLKAAWGSNWGTFTEEFPNGRDPNNVKLPVITYAMKSEKPGIVGRDIREIKPRHRETIINGEAVSIFSQVYDYIVAFDVWCGTNTEANQLANRFKEFMTIYAGYFKQNGVRELIFIERTNSNQTDKWKENIVGRKFIYHLQLEHHTQVVTDVIKKIIVAAAESGLTNNGDNQ